MSPLDFLIFKFPSFIETTIRSVFGPVATILFTTDGIKFTSIFEYILIPVKEPVVNTLLLLS